MLSADISTFWALFAVLMIIPTCVKKFFAIIFCLTPKIFLLNFFGVEWKKILRCSKDGDRVKKLIETAIPLEAINSASATEKSIRHGHPSTLHLWWARRPLATARAVLFASLIDDPAEHPEKFPTLECQQAERERLFKIIGEIVKWENVGNEQLFFDALAEIINALKEASPTKKLIETAMPLEAVNSASATEKSIRHGHPSTLHLWWSRKPTATSRAVLFASLIDDPAEHPEKFPTLECQQAERERLFKIIGDIVKWENSGDKKLFDDAFNELAKSVGNNLPAVFDPFAGGGSIPLEAQRLGLKAFAADFNPVAVIINKAMIELPAKFKNQSPVNPKADKLIGGWHGAEGLANDILYYGKLLKARAFEKIGHLYPKADGKTVIAWLWARTVTCSNPACTCQMPLVHSFKLSTKQNVFVQPIVDGDKIRFEVRNGSDVPEGTVNRNGARCLHCNTNVPLAHVRAEAKAGRMSAQLMAIVAEGLNGRIYLAPDESHEHIADVPKPDDFPAGDLPDKALGFRVQEYGITEWHQLFTNRQLTALTTFSELIDEICEQVQVDGGSQDYADALAVYLAFTVDKIITRSSMSCNWDFSCDKVGNLFTRQAISMVWSFAEANPFSNSTGCFDGALNWTYESVKEFPATIAGEVFQHDALTPLPVQNVIVSTDPPYYDNIGYANLSEFFYVWLRRPLKKIYPKLFGRLNFSKDNELIAEPARHDGDKIAAKNFFEDGMFAVLKNIHAVARADFPVTIYYAFKQKEAEEGGEASTGWETMLTAIIRAGFQITATWPMRTEMKSRMRSHDSNALASSIVLACRKRPPENKVFGKVDFIRALRNELQTSLDKMTHANIAPVDMAQAAIGPGISVYSRYERITDMNDNELSVRDALKIINAELAEFFGTQTGGLDSASQFCVDMFTQSGFNEISFGEADVLARAKNISVDKLEESGAVISARGRVRLRDRDEMIITDENKQLIRDAVKKISAANCAWLWVQSLVKIFKIGGYSGCGELLTHFDGDTESLKNLAYRLYNIMEIKSPKEASCYNELVVEWQDILNKRAEFLRKKPSEPVQGELF